MLKVITCLEIFFSSALPNGTGIFESFYLAYNITVASIHRDVFYTYDILTKDVISARCATKFSFCSFIFLVITSIDLNILKTSLYLIQKFCCMSELWRNCSPLLGSRENLEDICRSHHRTHIVAIL